MSDDDSKSKQVMVVTGELFSIHFDVEEEDEQTEVEISEKAFDGIKDANNLQVQASIPFEEDTDLVEIEWDEEEDEDEDEASENVVSHTNDLTDHFISGHEIKSFEQRLQKLASNNVSFII